MILQVPRAVAVLILTTAAVSFSQQPSASPAKRPPLPKPVNLQVLPKDMSPEDLMALMKQYSAQLGVKCNYCHAIDPRTHKLDFSSDDKMEKTTARMMIVMTRDINEKYVDKLPAAEEKVTCGTCHRGMPMPPAFNPPPEKDDIPPPNSATPPR